MEHRHLLYASQMSEINHAYSWNHRYHPYIWNHRNDDPRMHLGNGYPALPIDVRVNSIGYLNHAPRTHDYPSSRFTPGARNHSAAYAGALHDPYLHPSSSGSYNQFQSYRIQHEPFSYGRLAIVDESSIVSPPTNNRRASSKRKYPFMPLVSDRGYVDSYYRAETSSNLHFSPDHLQTRPIPGPHFCPLDSTTMVPSYWRNDHLTTGHGSHHIETNPAGAYSSSNPFRHFRSTANVPGLNVAGQWNHSPQSIAPHRRILSSDSQFFNYEMNQSLLGSSVTNGAMEIGRAYNTGVTRRRNPVARLSAPHGASTRGTGMGFGTYDQRPTPYRATSSHPFVRFAAAPFEDARLSGVEAVASSSRSRPLPSIRRSTGRNRRARNLYGGRRSSHDDDSRNQSVPEAVITFEPSIYYESSDSFDQFIDMRLDIDGMNYEELLALEERIGNIDGGLSEDSASRCLVETIYRSSDRGSQGDREERNCVVCQEEYKDLEKLGRLNCGHDYHASCIKEWLMIKNFCPMCRAPALVTPPSKEKQTISL